MKTKSEWGQVKFNPKKSDTEPIEPATPWQEFKQEMSKDERESQNNAVDLESSEAKQFLNRRNQNYRRMLINTKRNEPTKWEDFNEKADNHQTHETKPNVNVEKKFHKFTNRGKSQINKRKYFNEKADNHQTHETKPNVNVEKKFHKFTNRDKSQINKKKLNHKPGNPFASQPDSRINGKRINEDTKTENWDVNQKNAVRKLLTKMAYDVKGNDLATVVKHLKHSGVVKKNRPQFKK